ncbi:ankyrin repeat domain-containing protein 6 [Genypterus blacodes]|uniref:ankyrin repeat domain-containing protein 6 n=1 Tax=Genypterus blacodes TaxID=154954 RepID=UPI003F759F5C
MSEQALVLRPPPPPSSSSCQAPGLQTALHRAAMVGNNDVIAALIQGGCAVDLQDRGGNTALHEACWHGFSQCVKLLVKAGAELNIRNKAGNTALHLACQNAHAQTARLLLLGGATPDAKNKTGDTCLHMAARYNNLTLTKILLSSLCSVTERNQAGDTSLHVAAGLNHRKMVQLLLEAGTDGNARNNAGQTALDKARDHNHKDVALLLARAPQVHRFTRGRTIRKQRERLKAERRTQSVTRVEIKDSSSAVEETQSQKNQRAVNTRTARMEGHEQPQGLTRYKARGDTYQLYTLYRDKDGNVRQAPADGCRCKPLMVKLKGELKATQEEMKLHILKVQAEVSSRLGKMERRNRDQIKVLDLLSQERAATEKRDMVYLIEQRAAERREDVHMTQAVSRELKRWCVSQLRDVDTASSPQYSKLLPSASVDQSEGDGEAETLPLLSVLSTESSASLATYVNILPSSSSYSLGGRDHESTLSRTYFEMKVDKSAGEYENTALFPLTAPRPSGLLVTSADPYWQPPEVQSSSTAAAVPLSVDSFSSSGSSSDREPGHDRKLEHGGRFPERAPPLLRARGPAGMQAAGTRTLEVFIDRPAEPTFNQERNNLHAAEVTQRFFETVSTQLERWYERKIVQVEQQAELRAEQDRKWLQQRISTLEEELQRLKPNENADS